MRQRDVCVDTLPVVELTDTGDWVTLGQAHGVTLSSYRRGRGVAWKGTWQTLTLFEPITAIHVLRWQTDKIIAQRITRD